MRATAGAGYFTEARLELRLTYDDWYEATESFDVRIVPEVLAAPAAVEVLDGRSVTLPVFRQKGNQGGGAAVDLKTTGGKGNGNGVLEPGEEAAIWVKLAQGMDPFDKNTWRRAKVYSDSPHVVEIADLEAGKQREWTGAMERTSLVRLSGSAPRASADGGVRRASALRSTLPLTFRGSSGSNVKDAGTMYAGSVRLRKRRSSAASGGCWRAATNAASRASPPSWGRATTAQASTSGCVARAASISWSSMR